VLVTVAANSGLEKSTDIIFRITDLGLGELAAAKDHFVVP
jgi:hypothetical protein